MSNTILERKQARLWLKQRAYPAKRWIQLTILVSFVSGLLLVGQLYLLAHICYGAYIEKLSQYELIHYFSGIITIILLRAGLSWLKEVVSFKAAAQVKNQLRADVVHHINCLGPIKAGQVNSGELISAAMEQVEGLNNFLIYFLTQVTLAGLMPLAILVFVFSQNIVCGVILLICAPLIPLFMMLIGVGAESENQKHFQALARLSGAFLDTLHGLTTLRLFNRTSAHSKVIYNYSNDYRITTMKVLRIAFLSSAVLEIFSAASIALVAIYLGMGFINSANSHSLWWGLGNMTLQGGLFVLLLAPEFFLPLRELSTHYHAKAEAMGAALELQKFFSLEPAEKENQKYQKYEMIDQFEIVEFRALNYCYEGKEKRALDNISFAIKRGQKVAVVGASGAGKTTLLNILMKFVHTKDNEVVINENIKLNTIPERDWLTKLSWLGQHTALFKGNIRYNLHLANPHATDDELWQVLKLAHLDREIALFPQQLDTEIGEQSIGLSGGQAQRLALARAYLKPCELLLLDEPTASLDHESEKLIMKSLSNNWQDKTVILLTHRLSYLAQMDHILVMKEGKIIQKGTLYELLKDKENYFASLYSHQLFQEEIECAH